MYVPAFTNAHRRAVGIVFLQSFKEKPWGELIFKNALIAIPIAIILFIILSLILGWLDTRLGFRQEELRNLSKSNPVMMEMLEELKELNRKLDSKNKSEPKDPTFC